MTRLDWDAPATRFFELGVDRGVLYVGSNPGVAWTGLISVSESPTGGEARPYYLDGEKYLNLAAAEEFEATITAMGAPREFGPCEGQKAIQNGLIVTHQPKIPFGFSYRTRVGNAVSSELSYKIHLVYNALTKPADKSWATTTPDASPVVFSWGITTLAPTITNMKPTAHLVIDGRYTDPDVLAEVEGLLYGDDAVNASLPTPDELIAIFSA